MTAFECLKNVKISSKNLQQNNDFLSTKALGDTDFWCLYCYMLLYGFFCEWISLLYISRCSYVLRRAL